MSRLFTRILLPTDFSEVALPAVACARELTQTFDAELHCLHVVDSSYQYWGAVGPETLPIGPPPADMLIAATERLTRFCTEHLGDLKNPPKTHVAFGRPFAEIIAYAKESRIELIVLGTHGRGAIAHVLLGSTTEKVVRKAPCAVLTVRSRNHQFVMP
jgi:nucleotide-binding universal stress UspA family protein